MHTLSVSSATEEVFLSTAKVLDRDFLTPPPLELPGRTLTAFAPRPTAPQPISPHPASPKPSVQRPQVPQKPVAQTARSTQVPAQTPAQARLAMAAAPKPALNLPPIPIRVAIAKDAKGLSVGTSDAGAVVDQGGKVIGQLSANTAVPVNLVGTGLQVGDWQTPAVVWLKPRTADGLVSVEGRWYRGAVQLITQSGGLLAVNHVDVESYLYSVVGAEMPASWPIEALKAQAIAARSYAIVHIARPASDFYDLGATPRWQAYNGATTETNTTHAAVNATRGILLSYQGGVVESLYASSNEIVRDVHGGFGMSQNGANELAQKNFNYQQILGHFYPGTGLAVLNIK